MQKQALQAVLNPQKDDAQYVLSVIIARLQAQGVPLEHFSLYGDDCRLDQAIAKMRASSKKSFVISGQGFEFQFATVANHKLTSLQISQPDTTIGWDEWISDISNFDSFVMARTFDIDYEYWQNATSAEQYIAAGKSYKHLPLVPNGLPPPLNAMKIDISKNPGRSLLRDGYVEAVGARLWLGRRFWSLTGADIRKISELPCLHFETMSNGTSRIETNVESFTNDENGQGELQLKLRSLLFPAVTQA